MSVRIWAPLLILIMVIAVVPRKWGWRYEWPVAMDTLAFSSVFILPLCAGIAAMESGRLACARDLILVSSKATTAIIRVVFGVWAAACLALVVSAAVIGACVLWSTSFLPPRPGDFIPLAPMVVAELAVCALGALVGWAWRSRVAPASVALGVFATIMTGYVVDLVASRITPPLMGRHRPSWDISRMFRTIPGSACSTGHWPSCCSVASPSSARRERRALFGRAGR